MIFFNSICEFFNKDIVQEFDKIYAENKTAIDSFFDGGSIFCDDKCIINFDFKKQISDSVTLIKSLFRNHKSGVFKYKEKKYLVQNIDNITKLYNSFCSQKTEFELFNILHKECPNAINQYCKNNSIIADRIQLYRKDLLSHSEDLRKLEPILVEQIQHEQLMVTFKIEVEGNSLRNLYYKQYFVNFTTDNEKRRILSSLEELDYYCSYNEIILKQPVLNYFLSKFCKVNSIDKEDYQACCEKLNLLRTFAFEQLDIKYNNIERNFKDGVELYREIALNKQIMPIFETEHYFKTPVSCHFIRLKRELEEKELERKEQDKLEQERNNKLSCIMDQDIIREYQFIQEDYKRILSLYPNGYSIYKKNKNEIDILFYRQQVIKDEEYIKAIEDFILWQNAQSSYTVKSRSCNPDGVGCYKYRIPFKLKHNIGFPVDGEYIVWEHFNNAFYYNNDVQLPEQYQYLTNNVTLSQQIVNRKRYYYDSLYDKVFDFIKTLERSTEKLTIVWGNSGVDDSKTLNNYHFTYLRRLLSEQQISNVSVDDLPLAELSRNILVVELRTENSHLIETCEKIIENLYNIKPLITYFSLNKAYDKEEVESLIEAYHKNVAKKEEEKRRREEQIRKQNEKAKLEEERKHIEVRNLMACVSNWNTSSYSSVKYFSLYYYYPTTCNWDADNAEWDVRNIIWNFKANPNKPTDAFSVMSAHRKAVIKIMPDLGKLFNQTFGNYLSLLTLVCIPSSKAAVTERRYKDFSEELCKITNMDNAYNFIHVICDGEAKHLGGTKAAQLIIDNNYFTGRYVVLFDDVITSGRSIEIFKRKLEQIGAYVVCAVSIGETRHERQGKNPIDML